MQKTRLGITVGLLGAAIYFMGLYGGYLITALLAAYVLLFEENQWLKRTAVRAVALMIVFSIANTLIYLLPNVVSVIDSVAGVFGETFYIGAIYSLASALSSALDLIEKVFFVFLGFKALTQGSVSIPLVDKLIDKYMG